jgi:hypothetical protein
MKLEDLMFFEPEYIDVLLLTNIQIWSFDFLIKKLSENTSVLIKAIKRNSCQPKRSVSYLL